MEELDCGRCDTELLIAEVKRRPALWDIKCAEYKDRAAKKRCWEELEGIFCGDGDTPERKDPGE